MSWTHSEKERHYQFFVTFGALSVRLEAKIEDGLTVNASLSRELLIHTLLYVYKTVFQAERQVDNRGTFREFLANEVSDERQKIGKRLFQKAYNYTKLTIAPYGCYSVSILGPNCIWFSRKIRIHSRLRFSIKIRQP